MYTFKNLLERFTRYVKIDTQSDTHSTSFPSTEKQRDLALVLKNELLEIGITDACVTSWGYVLGTLPTNIDRQTPTIMLCAHLDTSPDVSGAQVNPQIHQNYDGENITLSVDKKIVLKIAENPDLPNKKGHTIITTDGTTLLGADNKAGIAEIMTAIHYLLSHPHIPRPNIRILFTPDEEVGRGTEHIIADDIKAQYGYTIDGVGVGIGNIECETFCADSMFIQINGKNVHPGYAKSKMINAIKAASYIIDQLPKEHTCPETTCCKQGFIHPIHLTATVEEATIHLIVRDYEEQGLEDKENFVKNSISNTRNAFPGIDIELAIEKSYKNMKYVLDKHPEVIRNAETAILRAGITPNLSYIRGGTDGAFLSYMGIPCPNLFSGSGNCHSKYEWISLQDMEKVCEVIVHLAQIWTEQ